MDNKEKALQIIKSDEMLMKYLREDICHVCIDNYWELYPIEIYPHRKQIVLHVKRGAGRLKRHVENLVKKHHAFFSGAEFDKKHRNSEWPDTWVLWYN